MLIKAYSVNKIGQKFLLPKIITDICIRKTSLSSQTDTKRAVREASLIPIVLCLIACKDRQSFSLILQMCQCFTTQLPVPWLLP